MSPTSICQVSRFYDAQDGHVLDISLEDGPGLLDDHLIECLDALFIQNHCLGAFAAAVLAPTQLLPIVAERCPADRASRALFSTRDAVEVG